jgi:hypothetical protein
MTEDKPIDRILHDLQERAKELNCLYRVDELLGREDATLDDVLGEVTRAVSAGCQFPDVCVTRIVLGKRVYEPPGFQPSPWRLAAHFEAQGEVAGQVEVYYTEAMPRADEGPFLAEERTRSPRGSVTSSPAGACSACSRRRRPGRAPSPIGGSSSTSCGRRIAPCSAVSAAR